MRPTLNLLVRKQPRLLASEAINVAETLKPQINNSYFATLPINLQNFFKKYPPPPFASYSDKPTLTNAQDANPFLPNKHPITKRYNSPKYSLRRQSDLYKAAYRFGVTQLMPTLLNNKKFYEQKHETKTPPRGATAFKLTKGERTKASRKEEVDMAISRADEIIAEARGAAYKRKLQKKKQESLPWY